jgi:uncharacterized RDD family membrane protein YckC
MNKTPTWKKVFAFTLDLFGSFIIFGYLIGSATHNIVNGGFSLNGGPALLLFALVIFYFVVMNKWLGGTFGKRIFRI